MRASTTLASCLLALASSSVEPAAQQRTGPARAARIESASPGPLGNGRFFWVGSDGNDPFTDEQLRYLVETASSIVIAQFYAGFDVEQHHELARRVKALDPSRKVFAYMSGTYLKPRFDWGEGPVQDAWILRDRTGQRIVAKFQASGDVSAYYADLSNPEYRAYLAGVAKSWMETAPYDGVIYDACNFLNGDVKKTFLDRKPPHPRANTPFSELLSQSRMDAFNAGLEDLLRETKRSLGDKLLIWNGFWRKKNAPDRSLALLPIGDIALAERWSIGHETDPRAEFHAVLSRKQILEDLGIVGDGLAKGKMFFLKDTFDEDWYARARPAQVERLARYGWAMYMLVEEPGRTAYGFSPGPRFSQNFHTDPVLLDVPAFGLPLGKFQELGPVLTREFEHGAVYLNATDTPATVKVGRRLSRVDRKGASTDVPAGEMLTIPAQDAVILQSP